MAIVGKYVEHGYEFIYTAKVPSEAMKDAFIEEKRIVFIPGDSFRNAYDVAEEIMGNADGFSARMVSLTPATRTKREDS